MNTARAMVVVAGVGLLALAGCGPDTPSTDSARDSTPAATTSSPSRSAGVSLSSASPTPGATGRSPGTGSHPPESGTFRTVTLSVGGGLAGRADKLVVSPDGSWRYTNNRGVQRTGKLSEKRRHQLAKLVGDPRLAAEAHATPKKKLPPCNDGMSYRLRVGDLTIQRGDCGGSAATPTFNAVLALLTDATPI